MSPERQLDTPVLLLPGASATGRDFLLTAMLENADIIGERLNRETPLAFMVAKKITDRPGRGQADLTKECITAEEFAIHSKKGDIIASYVLESNGHNYGYRPEAFRAEPHIDVVVADASVYQIPEMRQHLGDKVYVAAMLATRAYRHENLTARGSETPEEVKKRLDLGDAHVSLLLLMHNDSNIKLEDFVDPDLAGKINDLIHATEAGKDTKAAEKWISEFSGSAAVPHLIKEFVRNPQQHVDELIVLGDEHRIKDGDVITDTEFFNVGVKAVSNAIRKAS